MGIGLFISLIGVAGFILGFHSNNPSQNVHTSQIASKASTLLSSQEESSSSVPNLSNSSIYKEETAFSAPTASQFKVWNTVDEKLLASNYSGPACAVMALSARSLFVSQSVITDQLGVNAGKVTDYRDLVEVLNQYLGNDGLDMVYIGQYITNINAFSTEEKRNSVAMFLSQVDYDLENRKIPLVVVGKSPDNLLRNNSWAVIVGKSYDNNSYRIKIPYLDDVREYSVNFQTLADLIFAANFFCYIV